MPISQIETDLLALIQQADKIRIESIQAQKMYDYQQAVNAESVRDYLVEIQDVKIIERLMPLLGNMKFLFLIMEERIKELQQNA